MRHLVPPRVIRSPLRYMIILIKTGSGIDCTRQHLSRLVYDTSVCACVCVCVCVEACLRHERAEHSSSLHSVSPTSPPPPHHDPHPLLLPLFASSAHIKTTLLAPCRPNTGKTAALSVGRKRERDCRVVVWVKLCHDRKKKKKKKKKKTETRMTASVLKQDPSI